MDYIVELTDIGTSPATANQRGPLSDIVAVRKPCSGTPSSFMPRPENPYAFRWSFSAPRRMVFVQCFTTSACIAVNRPCPARRRRCVQVRVIKPYSNQFIATIFPPAGFTLAWRWYRRSPTEYHPPKITHRRRCYFPQFHAQHSIFNNDRFVRGPSESSELDPIGPLALAICIKYICGGDIAAEDTNFFLSVCFHPAILGFFLARQERSSIVSEIIEP